MTEITSIIGLQVVAIKGTNYSYQGLVSHLRKYPKKTIYPEYIFFSDGETFIQLEEQDYHIYHDCASWAREIRIHKDKMAYNNLISSVELSDTNTDL